MLNDFLMFYAPFLVVIVSIAVAFWFAPKDDAVKNRRVRRKDDQGK